MQKRNSIINIPLLAGATLSIALHGVAIYSKGIYSPPQPKLKMGQTVVQLTLVPSVASQSATSEPEPQPVDPEKNIQPIPEEVIPTPDPIPVPVPEPVIIEPPTKQPLENTPEPQPQNPTNSEEENASQLEDKGISSEAVSSSTISPKYPRRSQRRGEEGNVTLLVRVLISGKTGEIHMVQSSGYKHLDEAAIKAVQMASFEPALQLGKAVESETELTFTFKLTNE